MSENKSWKVAFNSLPTTLEELQALPEASLSEPHYAGALLIPALCLWPENKDEALKMINFLKGPDPLSNHDIQQTGERLKDKAYLPKSYFDGAVPKNNYEPAAPYTVTLTTNPYSYANEGYVTLYVASGGADSPRPLQVRQKPSTGQWFLVSHSLLVGIRVPESEDPWA